MRTLNIGVRLGVAMAAVACTFFAVGDRVAVAGATPTLAIDADPSGTPCSPVDATRSVAPGTPVSVALCLLNADVDPINGGITSFTGMVDYTSPLSAVDNVGDANTGLGGNPSWNAAGLGGAAAWDCNVLNLPAAAPNASPSPASITCATNSLVDQAVPATAFLGTLTVVAPASPGVADVGWNAGTAILAGPFEGFCGDISCSNAQITVTGTGPTATPVGPTNTPTSTTTPCSVSGATCTPISQVRRTVTPTPTTGTAVPTPPAGGTPVPGQPTQAPGGSTPSAGGSPGGSIQPPDTGSGGDATLGGTAVFGLLVLGAVGLIGAGTLAVNRLAEQRRRQ